MKRTEDSKDKKKKTDSKKSKSKKIVILETKKGFEEVKSEKKLLKDDFGDEEQDENFEFSEGFKLGHSGKRGIEDIRVGTNLENSLIFAPRASGRRGEAKNYAETKYEKSYGDNKYGQKTPGLYEEKSSEKETPNSSKSNGNQ